MEIIDISDPKAILAATAALHAGGIVIYPTETCYGVAVDATNKNAVDTLLKYKNRPSGKAISIAVSGKQMAEEFVEINSAADRLYSQFLPGPVTVISNSKKKVDDRLESEKGTLGVRISSYPFVTELIKQFGKPITATSANSSGKKTPYSKEDIINNITIAQSELISVIVDAGTLPNAPSSTVIDTTTDELKTYRTGAIQIDSNTDTYISNSVEETEAFGSEVISKQFDDLSEKPLLFLLEGDLGAGKTHFVKGIAQYLKINDPVKSPTFNYVEEYEFDKGNPDEPAFSRDKKKGLLYHIDAWRLDNVSDLKTLALRSYFKPRRIVIIEWPSVIEKLLPDFFEAFDITRITIQNEGSSKRRILVKKESAAAADSETPIE